jgi:hypothetical protein
LFENDAKHISFHTTLKLDGEIEVISADFEINSCSKENTVMRSSLALHTTHTTTEAFSLIHKEE